MKFINKSIEHTFIELDTFFKYIEGAIFFKTLRN